MTKQSPAKPGRFSSEINRVRWGVVSKFISRTRTWPIVSSIPLDSGPSCCRAKRARGAKAGRQTSGACTLGGAGRGAGTVAGRSNPGLPPIYLGAGDPAILVADTNRAAAILNWRSTHSDLD